ncbi:MAG: hypothetical protein V5A79_06890 [Candidatus Bipolaricaulota bacterium]
MKKLIIILVFVALFLSIGINVPAQESDGPYLVCDPMKDENVTHFEIELNNEIIRAEKYQTNSTHFQIHYDLSGLEPGEYEARARSANNEWDKASSWTDSISWNVPSNGTMPMCENLQLN